MYKLIYALLACLTVGVAIAQTPLPIRSDVFIDPRDPRFGAHCTGYAGLWTYPSGSQSLSSSLGSGGTGYALGDTFSVSRNDSTGGPLAAGQVTGISAGGVVTSYAIVTPGGGYSWSSNSTVGTTALTGAGSGMTIVIPNNVSSSQWSSNYDDTAGIQAALNYAAPLGYAVVLPDGCYITHLVMPNNAKLQGAAMSPTYSFGNVVNKPTLFLHDTGGSYGVDITGAQNVSIMGIGISGYGANNGGAPSACVGTSTPASYGPPITLMNVHITGCTYSVGAGISGSCGGGGYVRLNSFFNDYTNIGWYGCFSDSQSVGDNFSSGDYGMWFTSNQGGLHRIINDRFEYINLYGIRSDSGRQLQIQDSQFDRGGGNCGIYLNGTAAYALNNNIMKGNGFVGALTITGAASGTGSVIRLTVTGYGNNPNGGGTATSGLIAGDTVNISGITGSGAVASLNGTTKTISTVVDGSHIELTGTTFGGTYTSGGLAAVNGKSSQICIKGTTDVAIGNNVYSNYSAATVIPSAYILEFSGTNDRISVVGGSTGGAGAYAGSGDSAYNVAYANYITTPAHLQIDTQGLLPTRTDNAYQVPGIYAGGTKFTTSGCSISATTGGATAGTYTSGTTGTCTAVITLNGATGLTAPTGWTCWANDQTTPADKQTVTATSTSTVTISGTTVSGDVINFGCMGY